MTLITAYRAQALEYLHALEIIHADIKSPNILVDTNLTTAKVADFGLARVAETMRTWTGEPHNGVSCSALGDVEEFRNILLDQLRVSSHTCLTNTSTPCHMLANESIYILRMRSGVSHGNCFKRIPSLMFFLRWGRISGWLQRCSIQTPR